MQKPSDKQYSETMVRIYFNYCAANDIRPTFEDMDDFITQVLAGKL